MGMWSELSAPWRAAFTEAWEAYKGGSVPIGAALADAEGNVLSVGRSRQYEKNAPAGQISWSKLSHAELNALLQVSAHDHPNIRSYALYTTVEPCPLCFGAVVMANVRTLAYAAADPYAGSAALNESTEYIRGKHTAVTGPLPMMDVVSTVLHTEFVLRTAGAHGEHIAAGWERSCPSGVQIARLWHADGTLRRAVEGGASIEQAFGMVEEALRTLPTRQETPV